MIAKRFGTLQGLTAPILIYESVDEVEKIKPGGCLEECNNNLVYRGPLNDVREIICDWLERKSGVGREMVPVFGKDKKPRKNDKGEIITEPVLSDGKYAAEVCAKKGWEDLSQFQSEVDAILASRVATND